MNMERNKFYFTFESDCGFPYQDTYLVVIADCKGEAMTKFQRKYPNIHKGCLNCSFVYDESQWDGILNQIYYPGKPVEIIQ